MIKLTQYITDINHRSKQVLKNIVISVGLKGLSILINLMIVPLTIDYINVECYGIWLTLSSVIIWFNFFDLGLGNGLRNKLAEAAAIKDSTKEKVLISTTYATVFLIALAMIALYLSLMPFLQWDRILGVSQQYREELKLLALTSVLMFCIQFVLQLINIINNAYQRSFMVSLSFLIGNVFTLIFILLLKSFVPGSLLLLGLAVFLGNIISLLFFSVYFFLFQRRDLMPRFRYISWGSSQQLLSLGSNFFVIQIAAIVQYQTTNILISRYFSSVQVAEYNISYKMFSVISMFFSLMVTPIWSAVTEAKVKNEYNWISNTEKKLLRIWIVLSVGAFILLLLSDTLYKLWLNGAVTIPFLTSFGVMLCVITSTFAMIYVNILNGLGILRTQFLLSIITMIYFIPLTYLLAVKLQWGIFGICISLILSNVNGIIAAPIEYYKTIKKAR